MAKRLAWPFRMTELPDTGGKMPPVEPGTRIVMLDETGEVLGSREFAGRLEKWRDGGVRETRFLIGAAESRVWGAAHAGPRASLPVPGEMALLPGFVLYALAGLALRRVRPARQVEA